VRNPHWTKRNIRAALIAWTGEHGRPPRAIDWRTAGYGRPCTQRVLDVFGSWNAGMRSAGLPQNRSGGQVQWSEEDIIAAMLDWLCREGRWPTVEDWRRADGGRRPVEEIVRNRFGSWAECQRRAGRASLNRRKKPIGL
jgi:hypothetical protein